MCGKREAQGMGDLTSRLILKPTEIVSVAGEAECDFPRTAVKCPGFSALSVQRY